MRAMCAFQVVLGHMLREVGGKLCEVDSVRRAFLRLCRWEFPGCAHGAYGVLTDSGELCELPDAEHERGVTERCLYVRYEPLPVSCGNVHF